MTAPAALPGAPFAHRSVAPGLLIRVGGEQLSLPTATVAEIVRPPRLSRVPRAFAALLGVASLRGVVVPILCLARLRGAEAVQAASPAARVVVLAQDPPLGLMVEAVEGFGDAGSARDLDLAGLLAPVRPATPRAPLGEISRTGPPTASAAPERPARAVLAFTVAGQLFGLDLADVVEVAPVPRDAVPAPDAGGAVVGVAAQRGGLLPLASARALLGRPAASLIGLADAPGTGLAAEQLVVAKVGGGHVGLVVDAVEAILRVPEDCVEPLPTLLARGRGEARVGAICRLDGGHRLLSLLSADGLFDGDTTERLVIAAQARHDAITGAGITEVDGDTRGHGGERFVVFELGGEPYALPVDSVDEVVRLPEVLTRVPRAPAFVEGVMNLRGAVVPVVDAARRFAASPAAVGLRRRVLVIHAAGLKVGLIVDGVSEILCAAPGELRPAPDLAGDEAGTFGRVLSLARDGRLILVMSPTALLAAAERDLLAALATASDAVPSGAMT